MMTAIASIMQRSSRDHLMASWFLEQLGWKGHAEDWGVAIDIAIDQVAALVTESGWADHLERTD